jgi:hypothetical protein
MWGTSSLEDKLTGDLGNVIEATSIGGRGSDFFYSRKIGARQFGTFATKSAKCRQSIDLLEFKLVPRLCLSSLPRQPH